MIGSQSWLPRREGIVIQGGGRARVSHAGTTDNRRGKRNVPQLLGEALRGIIIIPALLPQMLVAPVRR